MTGLKIGFGTILIVLATLVLLACQSEPPTPTPEPPTPTPEPTAVPTPVPTPLPTPVPTPASLEFHNHMGDCYNMRIADFEGIAAEWGTILLSDVESFDDEFVSCIVEAINKEETQSTCFANFAQDIRDAATYGNADVQTVARSKAKLRQCIAN